MDAEHNPLAFLEGEAPPVAPEEEPPPQALPAEAAIEPEGPSRGPDGRFAPRVGGPETRGLTDGGDSPAPAVRGAEAPEPGHVPITAMLDERERRQAAERRLADYEARQREWAEAQRQAQLPPEHQLAAQRYADNLRYSRKFAERAYGPDTLAEVHDWAFARCDADPHFNAQMLASEDPYEAAYQAWRREQLLAEVSPDDLDDYRAWKAQKASAGAPQPSPISHPAPAVRAGAPPQPPPRSLASAPNAGGPGAASTTPVGPGEAFRAAIR